MEFPAISLSTSSNFPARYLGKRRTPSQKIPRRTLFRRKPLHIRTSIVALVDNNGSFSVSETCTDESDPVSLNRRKEWIHFVGIGGSGMSALAMLALKQGYEVSGSDLVWSSFMDRLNKAGACLCIGHSVSNLQRKNSSRLPNAVVVSSAIPQNNVEILHAKSFGIPVYKRDCWLGNLTQYHKLIAVSGSHGKSTTAAMLAYVLNAMGDDLTAIVGADVPQFTEGNIITGSSETFVLEADEYDGCFLHLSPYIAVVTNVEWEHVDIFPDEEAVRTTFRRFLNRIRKDGHLILCGDSEGANSLLSNYKWTIGLDASRGALSIQSSERRADSYKITTFGISSSNEWHASSVAQNSEGGTDYTLCTKEKLISSSVIGDVRWQISVYGFQVIATIVAMVRDESHVHDTVNRLRLHLKNFRGVSRRFEMIGSIHGCYIFDDYAHHPTEIRAVLQAARQRFPFKALLVVFQPHTNSRLAALKKNFAIALSDADQVVITEVYAARETDHWNVSGRDLSASIFGPTSEYIPSLGDVVDKLALQICKDPHRDIVVLTLGAGDITTVGPKLLNELQKRLQ
ncbi:UDP-N-acetylmuramate--L-alanine ligase [Parasponia andersonii]|uniref:UDP-N-acetylmuramate--L-alanine ligase n=1 Tax=Parasponia andersonii TaxID=3476 RepID=A0A2P5CAV2_PARAD|nr:UDP-N-acetylmuramate--L-alanine ligase [Parasponia andersonii]